jgi:RNA polymerase sigma factor (sigma-70 family)
MDKIQETNEKLEDFKNKNKLFLKNPLIQNFLKDRYHAQLFQKAISNPTLENKEELDRAFKLYYFNVRFTSFISSTIYFNAINYDKKQRKHNLRHLLTIDSPAQNDEDMNFKDSLVDPNGETTIEKILDSEDITDYIEDPILYEAVNSLSKKQKEVLSLAYIKCLTDTDIAKLLNKSQQSVSKIHKRALEKIQEFFKKEDGIKK